jgi:hypothetical protein
MARPPGYQWQPIGLDADPVPGDPSQISEEIAHLTAVARQITGQVAALRKIGGDSTLAGKYADKLRSKSNEVAGDLTKVVGRYQKVASALSGWLPDLEHAQAQSLTALSDAEGPYKTVSTPAALPVGSNLTAQQKQQVKAYHTTVNQAQEALSAAKALLGKATALRDHSGSYHAGLIRSAIDDAMKDSFWDQFKNAFDDAWDDVKDWVKKNAWWIGDICTALEVIGTILAVAAFIIAQFIPGLDVLVDGIVLAAFLTTATAAAGRLLLAGTGNGSWWDFALDAFACATFGAGKLVSSGIRVLAEGSEETANTMIASDRAVMLAKGEAQLSSVADLFDDQSLCRIAVQYMQKIPELVPDLAKVDVAKLPVLARVAINLGGSAEDVENFGRLYALGQRFPAAFADAASAGKVLAGVMGIGAGASTLTGVGSLTLGGVSFGSSDGPVIDLHIPGVSSWYKSTFEVPTGGG